MPTKKKRQPVQIDATLMSELKALSEVLGGVPITRLVRSACTLFLKGSVPYQAHLRKQARAKKQK